jgi:uncharacterized protein YbjT (DUF2867 family)
MLSGVRGEIQQGKNVAEAARQANVQHVVYGSAGTGARNTSVPSWDSKIVVEDHIKALGLPLTILRPMAFMQLMTDAKFFPPISTWQVMPALMGRARPLPWLSAGDLGMIAAKTFAELERFVGLDQTLASDVQTIDQFQALYASELGKPPPRFPIPPALFKRFGFVGQDLSRVCTWLKINEVPLDTKPTLSTYPQAITIGDWLRTQRK